MKTADGRSQIENRALLKLRGVKLTAMLQAAVAVAV